MDEKIDRDQFVDNFIFLDSYPIEKLKGIDAFLNNTDLTPYITPPRTHKIIVIKSINQILFPEFCFINKEYEQLDEWKDLCSIVNPLVEFMSKQVDSKFKNHYPCHAEINSMPPNTKILKHKDDHYGVGIDYRVHLVLETNDDVEFIVEGNALSLPKGSCFIFDNSKLHEVHNNHSLLSRTHLVIDYSTSTVSRKNGKRNSI